MSITEEILKFPKSAFSYKMALELYARIGGKDDRVISRKIARLNSALKRAEMFARMRAKFSAHF